MKIATKIAAGYGILIVLILAVLSYQVSSIHRMQAINQNLSGIHYRAASLSLQMLRDLDQVEEFTRKFFATRGDPGYASQVKQMRDAFAQSLRRMQSLGLPLQEEEEISRLARLWDEFSDVSSSQTQEISLRNSRQIEDALSDQIEHFTRLRTQTQTVVAVTRQAIDLQAEESAGAGQQAERVSWIVGGAALLLSLLVSLMIVRSISEPLGHLTEGTRAVTEGKLFYQLDATGNDEFAQLAGDFNAMARRLNELDKMKKDFVSHVSHEFKTPLASMQETVRLLLDRIPGPLNDKQKRLLELNLQSGSRLSSMIGNLLDVSRMEAGVMEYDIRQHDLAGLLRTVLAEFETQLRGKELRMEAQLPEQAVRVDCDGDRIIQVIANLLGNALKFSPPGGVIGVSLRLASEMPDNVPEGWRLKVAGAASGEGFALVSVSDSGPGVPSGEKGKIFEKFHQGRQAAMIPGQGAGLGLAIGRTIVEAHRGAIWVEDRQGGGSVFYLLLGTGTAGDQTGRRASFPI
ncbi:MAG: HAMP domain-containing protein [Acidobacteria bacterium]|nr:HAMP domain-containing protein [Acidobacteriota bacterium]